jgi:methylated-DNA-[protein]-cysteine S-methyltransferase
MRVYSKIDSVIGELFLVAEDEKLAVIHLGEDDFKDNEDSGQIIFQPEHPALAECSKQLGEYFEGTRRKFDLPLAPSGTDFQQAVWKQLSLIPYGETRSYLEIAEKIGNPKAVRAIGQANKANRYPIIIPCHRVIGKNRTMTGYAGSRVDLKEKLLQLEGLL